MAHAHNWTSTEDNLPNQSSILGAIDADISSTRKMVRERIGQEHLFALDNSNQQGWHRIGSARVWFGHTEPTSPFPDPTGTEVDGTEDDGRLWIDETTGIIKMYVTDAWVVLSAVEATAFKLVARDTAGRAQVADPDVAADIATKNYVDTLIAALQPQVAEPVGTVKMFAGGVAPDGYFICDGSAKSITTYADLYAVIGVTYGDPGGDNFSLPDLRGASPVGAGTSVGYTRNETFTRGVKSDDQMQGHIHTVTAPDGSAWGSGVTSVSDAPVSTNTSAPLDDGTNGTPRIGSTTHGKVVGINFIIRHAVVT